MLEMMSAGVIVSQYRLNSTDGGMTRTDSGGSGKWKLEARVWLQV